MKKITLLLICVLISMVGLAQPPVDDLGPPPPHGEMPPPHERMHGPIDHNKRAEKILERLNDQIDLTRDQKNQIESILAETTKQVIALEQKNQPKRDKLRAKIEQLKNSNLSWEEKREQMHTIKEEHKPEMMQFKTEMDEIRIESRRRINEILTIEQKARLFELMSEKEMRPKRLGPNKIKREKTKRKP